MSTPETTITDPTSRSSAYREFAAPPEQVFRAHVEPDLIVAVARSKDLG